MASLRDKIASWNYGGGVSQKPIEQPYVAPVTETAQVLPMPVRGGAELSLEAAEVHGRGVHSSFYTYKTRLHQKLLTKIDLAAAESMPADQLRQQLRHLTAQLIDEEALPVNDQERADLIKELQNEILGLGPIEPLLADPTISEIMVNGYSTVFVERRGKLELAPVRFEDNAHVIKVIDRIVSRVGRRIDESSPMVDARLPDGSRVNAIIPPLALDGPSISIRRFAVVPLVMEDLVTKESLTRGMAVFMAGLVKAKANILISGGTGSGKTTLLNILSGFIPGDERIVTIEDTAELQLQQSHVVRLETRPPNIEGKGEVTMRALVKNSLRMRPDRIVLGEVRGEEVNDMLQAMNTGHDGSLTTIHANNPRDALGRLENLIGMGGVNLPVKALRQQISSAINIVIQTNRLSDGSRRITSVQEITGMEGDIITMQEVFYYERRGVHQDGSVNGRFRATGIRPVIAERLKVCGIQLAEDLFDPDIAIS
jgi:pilus assembly protein CpaF